METISNKISSGSTGQNKLLLIFARKAVKLENVVPSFQVSIHFHRYHSLATDDAEKFQCLNIVLNNKIGRLFLESS